MAYYTKYNNKDYNLNLNAVDSTKYPTADTSGRPCKTSAYSTGISQDSGFRTGSTTIYTQLARAIKVTKNSNISSISVTYTDIDGNSQTKTAAGTYYAKPGTTYSWSATAATNYDISGTRSGSTSGSGTLSADQLYEVKPTAVRYYTFTLTNSSGSYCTTSITASPALSSGGHIHVGETFQVVGTLNSSYYGNNKMSMTASHPTGGTWVSDWFTVTNNLYQTANGDRVSWTTSANSTYATPLVAKLTGNFTVGEGNITCTVSAPTTTFTYHEFASGKVTSGWCSARTSTTFKPFGNTGIDKFNYYPTNWIQVDGNVDLSGTASNFDSQTLSTLNVSRSIKHAGLTRSINQVQIDCVIADSPPSTVQLKVTAGSGGGAYRTTASVWGARIPE